MMAIFKRGLSLFLSLVLVFSMVPVVSQAEEEPQTQVDSGDVTVEGTNSVGTLLSEEIQEYQEADETAGGYNVVSLTIEDGVATAEFRTLESAILIVGVYTEDGMQLLLSGKAEVQPEESTVSITLEGTMPEYFVASAYLVDTYDFSPLCTAYETVMYTQEMQELLASTVEDYEADRVLQLDDSGDTNFAVYDDAIILIEEQEGVNTVASVDNENAVYIFENIDENITSLKQGDIFAYSYGETDVLLVKVDTLSVEGTTATITGADLELEEVFSHMKLDSTGNTTDITVDESTGDEDVTYDGEVTDDTSPATRNSGSANETYSKRFSFKKTLKTDDATASVSGYLDMSVNIYVSFYLTMQRQELTCKLTTTFKNQLTVSGAVNVSIKLKELGYEPIKGVLFLGFKPQLNMEFAGQIQYTAVWTATLGFKLANWSFQSLNTTPRLTAGYEVDASVYIGIDLAPQLQIQIPTKKSDENSTKKSSIKLATVEFTTELGIRIAVKIAGTIVDTGSGRDSVVHACKNCASITVTGILKFNVQAHVFCFHPKSDFDPISKQIGTWYHSYDYGDSGSGTCPHYAYRVTIRVKNTEGKAVAGATIASDSGEKWGTTNSSGTVVKYVPKGIFKLIATVDGNTLRKTVKINESCKIDLNINTVDSSSVLTGTAVPDSIADASVVAKGSCGSNVTWKLYNEGTLIISGSGTMYNWEVDDTPWYSKRKDIKSVVIRNGVTRIGNFAFRFCDKITTVTMGNSVTSIGNCAFTDCSSLTSVIIPDSVTTIGISAFYDCSSLTSVIIPDSVTSIGHCAFTDCSSLTSVIIPDSVTSIGHCAFMRCGNLTSVTIPEGVNTIGDEAFEDCEKLTSIRFKGNAPSIGDYCFLRIATIAYYPAGNSTWTSDVMQNYGGTITWFAYDTAVGIEASAVSVTSVDDTHAEETASMATKKPTTRAVFGGEYDTEVVDSYTLKTASFSSLVADEEYLLLALVSLEAEEPLAADNLLAIDQGQAGEDGTLVFEYVQRVDTPVSYVMACGASNKNLLDAGIKFPFMNKTDEVKAVDPVVTYDGTVLTEGVDYTIVGTVDYTTAGTFTCYVRGIYNYTGLVECTYTVENIDLTETEDYLYMTLHADCQTLPALNKNLYIDLNGYDLTGTVTTNGYKIYGMDSTTDNYTCEAIGYMNLVDENSETVVPVTHFKRDITGSTKRYMSIKNDNGYSFHRFYMGITHQTLKPTTTGVGYKAVFYGDSMIVENLDSFGFTMQLGNYTPKTFTKTADGFVSGKTVTLRIDNFDVEKYGETNLCASVMLKLLDGTVIESTQCSMTMRNLLETLNTNYTNFNADQLTAIADMIKKYTTIQSWKVENLI